MWFIVVENKNYILMETIAEDQMTEKWRSNANRVCASIDIRPESAVSNRGIEESRLREDFYGEEIGRKS